MLGVKPEYTLVELQFQRLQMLFYDMLEIYDRRKNGANILGEEQPE